MARVCLADRDREVRLGSALLHVIVIVGTEMAPGMESICFQRREFWLLDRGPFVVREDPACAHSMVE